MSKRGIVSTAAIQIFPSLRGFENELTRQIIQGLKGADISHAFKGQGGKVGDQLGDQIGDQIKKGAEKGTDGLSHELGEAGRKGGKEAGDGIEKGLEGAKDRAKDILGDLGIGATVVGAFAGALSTIKNRGQLQATLGLTPADAATLGQVSGKIYADNWGESAEDVNATLTSLVQNANFKVNDPALQGIAEQVLAAAQTFGEEGTAISAQVGQLVKNGVADNAQQALDIIVAGFQSGANKADDLLDTFEEYSTQFRKLGIDGPQALGLVKQALNAGARDTDTAADALKEFSIRAIDGSATTKAGFEGIGLNATKMGEQIVKGGKSANDGLALTLAKLRAVKDPVLQSQLAVDLFGTKAEDLGAALYALDPATAAAALGSVKIAGASQAAADAIGTTASPLETLKRQVMGVFGQIGEGALPVLQPFFDIISAGGKPLATMIVAVGGVAATAKTVVAVTKAWTTAQVALDLVLSANPIGLVVIALGLLVIGFIYAWKNSEKFRDIVKGVFREITSIMHGAGKLAGDVKEEFGMLFDYLPGLGPKIGGAIKSSLSDAKSEAGAGFSAIGNISKRGGEAVLSSITSPIGKGVQRWRGYYAGLTANTASGWHNITGATGRGVDASARTARTIGAKIGNITGSITSPFRRGFGAVSSVSSNAFRSTISFASSIPGRISGAVGDLSSTLYNAGRQLIQGFEDGIGSKIGDALGAVGNLGSSVLGKLTGVLDINSPSRKSHWIGEMFGTGFGDGVESMMDYTATKAAAMGDNATGKLHGAWVDGAAAAHSSRPQPLRAGGVSSSHTVNAPITVHSPAADGRVVGSEVSRRLERTGKA